MESFIFILILLAVLGVFGSLLFGLFNLSKEGQEHREKSNKMMWTRVYLQGAAILLLVLFAAIS